MAERPNPQSIGICALIALYSDPNSHLHELEDDEGSPIAGSGNRVAAFLEESVFGTHRVAHRVAYRGIKWNGNSSGNNNSHDDDHPGANALGRWMERLRSRLGTQARDLLAETLRMASESVDALVDLFDSLRGAMHEGLVDASSLHGLYLRQHCLGFGELSFESSVLLWRALGDRVRNMDARGGDSAFEPSEAHSGGGSNKNLIDIDTGIDTGIDIDSNFASCSWPLSTEQLQSIVREDCIGFERDRGTESNHDAGANDYSRTNTNGVGKGRHEANNNTDALPIATNSNSDDRRSRRGRWSFERMEVYIRKMLAIDPELPVAHFLRYLNCLRHGERVGALEALHEYFDHSMVQHTQNRNSASGDGFSRDILQFSAILLAMTHSSFGNSNLALLATEEAVRVAQQSKDAACVAFALGWLYEHRGQGIAERTELLRRCSRRASGTQLRPLVAGAQLTLARSALLGEGGQANNPASGVAAGLQEGGQSRTATSWNHLLQVTAEPSTDHGGAFDRPTHLSQNPREVLESMALQRLVSAGIWDSLGMPVMSKWASKAALSQHHQLSYDDLLAAIQNIARCALHGSPPKQANRTKKNQNGQKECCAYARAIDAMLQLRIELNLDGNDLEEPILQHLALVFHEWAVRRGDTDDAMALQTMLDSYLHPGLYNRDRLYADIRLQKHLFFCHTKNWEKAKQVGTALVRYCKQKGFLEHQVRVLIQMGIAELEVDRNQCTTALSPLLEALTVCEQTEMHGLHAAAMSILARVFLGLRNPKRAIAVLDGTLPALLQREHVWFRAEAYLSLARAHLALAASHGEARGRAPGASGRRHHRALRALGEAVRLFEECQDRGRLRETCYLQARIHALLRNTKERDEASERFLVLAGHPAADPGPDGGVGSSHRGSILDAIGNPHAIRVLVGRSVHS